MVDQALAPGLVHHPANRVDIQRRAVGRVTVGPQRRHQRDHMAGLEPMPGHIDDVAVDKAEPIGGVLKDVAHGLLAGWGQAGHVLQQRIFREVGQSVNPVAKRQPGANRQTLKQVKTTYKQVPMTAKRACHSDPEQCHHLDIQGLCNWHGS